MIKKITDYFSDIVMGFFSKKTVIENNLWHGDSPCISVVIPFFAGALESVNASIKSLLTQTYENFEIIIVVGESADQETIAKLKAIKIPQVRVHFHQDPSLVTGHSEQILATARGKYLCCLDPGLQLQVTYLEKALFYAESCHYDIVYPLNQSRREVDNLRSHRESGFFSSLSGMTMPAFALCRRDVWERSGGYREAPVGGDGSGFRVKVIPEVLVQYRERGEVGRGCSPRDEDISSDQSDRIRYVVNNPFINMQKKQSGTTNVLLALPFMVTGGADEVLLRILGHLAPENFAFSCITTLPTNANISGDNSPRYEKITREVYHLHKFLESKKEKRDFIFYLLETRPIDIILIVGCSFIYQLIPEIKKHSPQVKIVDQLFNPFGHIINNRRYAKKIDLNIVANESIEEILVNWFRERKEKVKVIIHGVDVKNEFSPEHFREIYPHNPPWKLRSDDFVVGFFGRFSKEKCPVKFVDIAARLKELDGITWLMTGGGDQFERVRGRIARNGLERSILTPGIVADVKPFLAGTHVVVIPSMIEGIPIVLMEAMSLGIPVVASRVGGIPDVIRDGHNGFLCAAGDLDGFAARIKLLHDDRSLWETMGKNAREFALNHLDVSKMLEEYRLELVNIANPSRGVDHEA